jgi:hypothetical protein
MRKIIWLIIAVILIVIFAIILLDHNPPIIMLQSGSKTYSTKLWNIILCVIIFLILIYIIFSLIRMIVRIPRRVKTSINLKRGNKQLDNFTRGIEAYISRDSLDLHDRVFSLFNDSDSKWRIPAGILLLADATRSESKLGMKGDNNYKTLLSELESLGLDDSQKYLVKYLSVKVMANKGKVLPASVVAGHILDDLELNYNLPKVFLFEYIKVLLEYGKLSCLSDHNDAVIHFIERLEKNIWLQKIVSNKKSYEKINKSYIYKLRDIFSNSLYLLFLNNKNSSNNIEKWINLGFECDLINDSVFVAYMNFLSHKKSYDFATKQLKKYLDDDVKGSRCCFSDKVFSFFVKANWISNEDKLDFAEPYFLKNSFKPTELSLCLMGDICFSNDLMGKAKSYYDKSFNKKITMELLICLAKFSLYEKDEKSAIISYQKAFDMLLSK